MRPAHTLEGAGQVLCATLSRGRWLAMMADRAAGKVLHSIANLITPRTWYL